jgi:hypothetical protein
MGQPALVDPAERISEDAQRILLGVLTQGLYAIRDAAEQGRVREIEALARLLRVIPVWMARGEHKEGLSRLEARAVHTPPWLSSWVESVVAEERRRLAQ